MERGKKKNQCSKFCYGDDIVGTMNDDPKEVLRAAKLLHPKLQFTIDTKHIWESILLNLRKRFDKNRKSKCRLYQKPTYAVTILNFRLLLSPSVQEKCD